MYIKKSGPQYQAIKQDGRRIEAGIILIGNGYKCCTWAFLVRSMRGWGALKFLRWILGTLISEGQNRFDWNILTLDWSQKWSPNGWRWQELVSKLKTELLMVLTTVKRCSVMMSEGDGWPPYNLQAQRWARGHLRSQQALEKYGTCAEREYILYQNYSLPWESRVQRCINVVGLTLMSLGCCQCHWVVINVFRVLIYIAAPSTLLMGLHWCRQGLPLMISIARGPNKSMSSIPLEFWLGILN